jgi:hypothetical protein
MNQTAAPVVFEELTAANGRRIGIATLASEKTLHAISLEMVRLLTPQLQQWQADPDVAMVILQAQGEKAFCAGATCSSSIAPCASITLRLRARTSAPIPMRLNSSSRNIVWIILSQLRQAHPVLGPWHRHGRRHWPHGRLQPSRGHRKVAPGHARKSPSGSIRMWGSWFLARMPGKTGIFLALTGANLNANDALSPGWPTIASPMPQGLGDRRLADAAVGAGTMPGAGPCLQARRPRLPRKGP